MLDFSNLSNVLLEVLPPARGFLKEYFTILQDNGKAFSSLTGKAGGLRYIIKMIFKVLEGRELKDFWNKPFLFPGTLIRFEEQKSRMVMKEIAHPEGLGEAIKAYTA